MKPTAHPEEWLSAAVLIKTFNDLGYAVTSGKSLLIEMDGL